MSDSNSHPTTSNATPTPTPPPALTPHKPTTSAIKVLAPLSSSAALPPIPPSNSTTSATHSSNDSTDSTSAQPVPPATYIDSDEPDVVAQLKGEHLLHNRWTFWYDLKDQVVGKPRIDNWGASLNQLMSFNSVEQFWGMINNIAKPSALPVGSDYNMFRYGVKPAWEDPENRAGGKWTWEILKALEGDMDKAWLNTLLAIIGENFSDEREICGVVFSVRKGRNRMALWTRTESKSVVRVGQEWKKLLGLSQTAQISFHPHSTAIAAKNKYEQKALYTV